MWTTTMIGLGAFFACLILGLADGIVELAFGGDYRPAGLALQILIITAVLIYIYMPAYQALIMFDQQMRLFRCLSGGALINVVLNIVLIPRFSLYGAAWATVATHMVILVQLFRDAAKYTPVKPMNRAFGLGLGIASASGFVAYLSMRAVSPSLWSAIPVGVLMFLMSFAGLTKVKVLLAERLRLSSMHEF
jgi:O-antigen/teichoic acid export membrane protein